jgi:hypothetical protein
VTGPTGLTGVTGPTGATGASGSLIGTISVPVNNPTSNNFNFAGLVSTLPTSFATSVIANPSIPTTSFIINLNSRFTTSNLPIFIVSGYAVSTTAGYIDVQRLFGSNAAPSLITINPAVTPLTLTFQLINTTNFPTDTNDSAGYGLYIQFQILN